MKFLRTLAALAVLSMPMLASAREVLVQTTSTDMLPALPASGARITTSVEVLNLGPNAIWCEIDATPVENKSRKIAPGASWSIDSIDLQRQQVKCLASTANQLTTAAAIVNEAH